MRTNILSADVLEDDVAVSLARVVAAANKTAGIVAAIVLILGGIVTAASGRTGDATLAAGIVAIAIGVFVGIFSYFLGVLVSAQGQILKASLDGAVNTSPFLANEHRIEIMTLPQ